MPEVEILKKYWGYDNFRPLQQDIIRAVLAGQDVLALMPTGGGKSICFQVPALVMEGICIVVSPLVALMKDQVENLNARGISAEAIFAGMGKREIDIILDNCIYGKIKFLYLSPERLLSELVRIRLTYMNVNLIAIDEAHCISQWGYDFRPPYLRLAELRALLPEAPTLALTATATAFVRMDILQKLEMPDATVFVQSFARKNLSYVVSAVEDKMKKLLQVIRNVRGSGLIYVRNRRETAEIAAYLLRKGISSDFYHAGLEKEERFRKQELWKTNAIQIMVATNAFGMGIDKPDVRTVLHLDLPESLEAYYQEAGRAGRDGKKAYAVLLANKNDEGALKTRIADQVVNAAFVKKVYQNLGSYYQLAYGAGEGLSVDFDLLAFCKIYKIKAMQVLSALKFLEHDGYLTLSENIFIPSRAMFVVDNEAVYRFQIEHAAYDGFVKTMLRSYGGMFDHYARINEAEIATRLGISYNEVVTGLKYLETSGLISYVAQTDKPQLTFLRARVDTTHLDIDARYMDLRQAIQQEQTSAVIAYAMEQSCRSMQLLHYFNEVNAAKCGVCDVCIADRKRVQAAGLEEEIDFEVITALQSGAKTFDELVAHLHRGSTGERVARIKRLLEDDKIQTDGSLYFLR